MKPDRCSATVPSRQHGATAGWGVQPGGVPIWTRYGPNGYPPTLQSSPHHCMYPPATWGRLMYESAALPTRASHRLHVRYDLCTRSPSPPLEAALPTACSVLPLPFPIGQTEEFPTHFYCTRSAAPPLEDGRETACSLSASLRRAAPITVATERARWECRHDRATHGRGRADGASRVSGPIHRFSQKKAGICAAGERSFCWKI